MRGLFLIAFALFPATLSGAVPARAADPAAAVTQDQTREHFARSFARTVLAIIQDSRKSYGDRKEVLRAAFSQSVDIDWIARFVLGKAWNTATPEQKKRYASLYRSYLTETYVANFAENPDKRIRDIKIFSVSGTGDDTFTVRTQMMLANFENLKVNYLVRDEQGKYKVLDIAIENVSLINTHRTEFAALASARGVEGVITRLETLVSEQAVPGFTLSMNSPSNP